MKNFISNVVNGTMTGKDAAMLVVGLVTIVSTAALTCINCGVLTYAQLLR